MERADVVNVAEDGVFVTVDFGRRALLVDTLQMVRRNKVHLLYKLLLTANELLDELAFSYTRRKNRLTDDKVCVCALIL